MFDPAEVGQGPERVLSSLLDVVPVGKNGSLLALLGVLRDNVFLQGMEARDEKCDFCECLILVFCQSVEVLNTHTSFLLIEVYDTSEKDLAGTKQPLRI